VTLSSLNSGTDAMPSDFIIPALGFTGGLVVFGGAWLAFLARRGKGVRPDGNKPVVGQ
jgi:hypothetical protein